MRRNVRIFDLVLRTRDDAHPRAAAIARIPLDRRKQDDVVDAHHIGLEPSQHARQIFLRPFRRRHDRLPAVLHIVVDLVERALAEVRDVAVDEFRPEPGHFFGRHGFGKIDRMGLEAIAPVHLEKAGIGQEHGLVAEPFDRLGDADRIERRTKGGFRKKGDQLSPLAAGRFRRLRLSGLSRRWFCRPLGRDFPLGCHFVPLFRPVLDLKLAGRSRRCGRASATPAPS